MKKLISMSLLALMALGMSGCDSTTANAPGNTTLGGAAIGGLSGAGIGAMAHGTKGALVGGLIGTAGGAVVGNQMERNRNAQMMQQNQYQSPYQAGLMPQSGPPAPRSY